VSGLKRGLAFAKAFARLGKNFFEKSFNNHPKGHSDEKV
jgi:hypothetical protein